VIGAAVSKISDSEIRDEDSPEKTVLHVGVDLLGPENFDKGPSCQYRQRDFREVFDSTPWQDS
jgi:hypothetical protein